MKTVEIDLYQVNELSEQIRERVLDEYREINVDDTWYEPICEGIKELAKEAGFDIKDIFFSGFYSQGDGAMFTYEGVEKSLLDQAVDNLSIPNWKKRILKNGYISGTGKHRGNYYHKRSCNHNIYVETDNGMQHYPNIESLFSENHMDIENYIIGNYENLCEYLYQNLRKYYEELIDDQYVEDTIIDNNFMFTKEGKRLD